MRKTMRLLVAAIGAYAMAAVVAVGIGVLLGVAFGEEAGLYGSALAGVGTLCERLLGFVSWALE